MKKIDGIIIPAVTPFDERGRIKLDWLAANYKIWNKTGICGVMALGTNGEMRAVNDSEALSIIREASEIIAEEKVFIAGIGRESTFQTLRFLEKLEAENIRIDYVSVLTPCYFRKLMTDEALVEYYTEVADASRYPVLLYCAPGYANNVTISPEVVRKLADHPNIAGIKDTTSDMMPAYFEAAGGRNDFAVIAGKLDNLMFCLEHGGTGGIISSANYFPNACSKLTEIYKKDGMEAAETYYRKIKELAGCTGGRGSIAGVKAVMNMTGKKGGFPRKPILPLPDTVLAEIGEYLADHKEITAEDQ